MRRIFLIGYMGSGKTTLGKAFAKAAGLEFIDLDWYIEERLHKTISKIFAEQGESGFREVERKLLHEAGDFEDVLIACGGGTPCFFDNMDYMNQAGDTVFLDVSPEVLFRRLKIAKTKTSVAGRKVGSGTDGVHHRWTGKTASLLQPGTVLSVRGAPGKPKSDR